jgi:hypothetical protein
MPVPERCGNDYTLISTKVPEGVTSLVSGRTGLKYSIILIAGVYVGTASAAREEGSLSGSHPG